MGGHLSIYRLGILPIFVSSSINVNTVKHIQIVLTIERERDLFSVCSLVLP